MNKIYLPVNLWNTIKPQVIITGLISLAFLRTDFTFDTIVLKEYFIGSPLWLIDDKLLFILLSIFNLDVRIFERIVSNSTSTFLCGPRSHWRDLKKKNFNKFIDESEYERKMNMYVERRRKYEKRKKGYLKSFFNKSHILSTSKFYLRQAIWVKFVSSKNEVGKYLIQIIPFLSIVPSNHISCNLNKVEHIWEFQDIPLFLISFLSICYIFILCQTCHHFFADHTYHIMHLTEHVWLITFFFQLCLVSLQRNILL